MSHTTKYHNLSALSRTILLFLAFFVLFPKILLPQFGIIPGLPRNPEPAPPTELTPDLPDHVKRPQAPSLDQTYISADDRQESEGSIYHLRGHAVLEQTDALLKADEIDYNEETGDAEARGHVFYENFVQNEKITCDRVEYNMDSQRGKFYNVKGYVKSRVEVKPGLLTSNNPFYFESQWAERIEDKYILHQGMITGCKLPHPWWTLRGPRFDIVPNKRAIAYNSWFHVRALPLFYTPFFYKSLEKEPRRSGFLTPNLGHSSIRGYMLGVGYYWAINRSYDLEYLFQDWTARGYAHHLDLRGKPNARTDFNVIAYGVQDRGPANGNGVKAPGADVTANFKSDLGDGWVAKGNIDYLSSLNFREQFTDSFNEAIFSASTSTGWVAKHFDSYDFETVAQRVQLFQNTDPGNYVILRKLPEVDFTGRDQQLGSDAFPLWFSFDSTAGLLHRSDPTELSGSTVQESPYSTNGFMPRLSLDPRLMSEFHLDGFTLAPSVALHEAYFGESFINNDVLVGPELAPNALTGQGVNRLAGEFAFDLIFPSFERVFNRKTFLGDKLKHVVETRAKYKYVDGVNDFNRLIRFDQTELLTDTNQVEFSVTNRLYAKRGDTVTEILTWQVSQQRYFDPTFGGALIPGQRNVTLDSLDLTAYAFLDQPRNYSPIFSNLRVSPINGVSVIWQMDYDPLRGGIIDSGLTADFRYRHYFLSAGNNDVRGVNLFNVTGETQTANQNFLSPPANQFRGLIGFGDTNRRGWNGAVSAVYDYRAKALQYAIAQVTYNTDCCGISVQLRRLNFGTRDDTQYRVAFTIANVGSFGNMRKQERIF